MHTNAIHMHVAYKNVADSRNNQAENTMTCELCYPCSRIVLSSDVRSNAKQNLADHRWLPVRPKIHFKIALLTFKSITTHRPPYLSDLLQFRTSSRHLRSSDHCLLHDAGGQDCFQQSHVLPRRSDNLELTTC